MSVSGSNQGWSVVSAAALIALTGAPALAGGFTSISISSGGYCGNGLSIGGSYSSWSGNHYRGFQYGGFGYGNYFNDCSPAFVPRCEPVYYRPIVRSYCPPPVVYVPPIVIQRPVYYTQPVVYTQPVQYQQTSYQPVVYQTPVVTRRVVTEESQPIIEETVIVKKAPQVIKKVTTIEEPAQRSLSAYEAGLRAIQDRKPGEAIDQLNEHLRTNPGDMRALRLSALMYAEQNNCAEAATRMIEAYKADASLANQPIDAASLGIGAGRLRDITNNAERYSMKLRTGSSLLVTTVLMQAEGRAAEALANSEKAMAAGLELAIAAGLEASLR